jgi:hypothetical protein
MTAEGVVQDVSQSVSTLLRADARGFADDPDAAQTAGERLRRPTLASGKQRGRQRTSKDAAPVGHFELPGPAHDDAQQRAQTEER